MLSLNDLLLWLIVALFYASAYDNNEAGFLEGNKRKLYETYSHCLVIILLSSLQYLDLKNES